MGVGVGVLTGATSEIEMVKRFISILLSHTYNGHAWALKSTTSEIESFTAAIKHITYLVTVTHVLGE